MIWWLNSAACKIMSEECLDLKALFGKKYRVVREANPDAPKTANAKEAAWYWEIPCKYGVIYPYNRRFLAACGVGSQKRNQLKNGPWDCVLYGDLEAVVLFEPKDMDAIAEILLPRRRKQYSEAAKAAGAERLAAARKEKSHI